MATMVVENTTNKQLFLLEFFRKPTNISLSDRPINILLKAKTTISVFYYYLKHVYFLKLIKKVLVRRNETKHLDQRPRSKSKRPQI